MRQVQGQRGVFNHSHPAQNRYLLQTADEGELTLLFLYLHANVVIDRKDYEVGHDVEDSHTQQYLRIFEWNLLGHLHHAQDDGEVCAA